MAQKEAPDKNPGLCRLNCCELPKQPRGSREFHPRKLLQQPTSTVRIGHGSPPVLRSDMPTGSALRFRQAVAGRSSKVTVGRFWERLETRSGTSALAWPCTCPPPGSFSRKRLPGNAAGRQGSTPIHQRRRANISAFPTCRRSYMPISPNSICHRRFPRFFRTVLQYWDV